MPAFTFCPFCGQRYPTAEGFQPQHCAGCGEVVFHNSKPCAGALVERDGRVLLVQRAIEPFLGYWDVPGGFLDPGEHPEDGARREVIEETGLTVELTGLVGIYVDTYGDGAGYTLNIYYTARPLGGELRPASDAAALSWFGPDEIPKQLAFRHAPAIFRDWRRLRFGG